MRKYGIPGRQAREPRQAIAIQRQVTMKEAEAGETEGSDNRGLYGLYSHSRARSYLAGDGVSLNNSEQRNEGGLFKL